MRHLLDGGAQLRIPEPDGRLMPPTGQQAAIGEKARQVIPFVCQRAQHEHRSRHPRA